MIARAAAGRLHQIRGRADMLDACLQPGVAARGAQSGWVPRQAYGGNENSGELRQPVGAGRCAIVSGDPISGNAMVVRRL